jgi:hypothetical protein
MDSNEYVELTYNLTLQDMVNYNKKHFKLSKDGRREHRRVYLIYILVPLAFAIYEFLINDFAGSFVFLIPTYFILFLIQLYMEKFGLKRKVLKFWNKPENKKHFGEIETRIVSDGLQIQSPNDQYNPNWDAIDQIFETNDYFFIYTGSKSAIVINKKSIIHGDLIRFREELKQHKSIVQCNQ